MCVFVNTCVCIYICIYTYLYIYVCICMRHCIHLYSGMCEYIYVY